MSSELSGKSGNLGNLMHGSGMSTAEAMLSVTRLDVNLGSSVFINLDVIFKPIRKILFGIIPLSR